MLPAPRPLKLTFPACGFHEPSSRHDAVAVFLVFAFVYFISALIRAITATLAPTLAQEYALNASDLGLPFSLALFAIIIVC